MPIFYFPAPAAVTSVPAPALSAVHSDRFDSGGGNTSEVTYTPVGQQEGDIVFAIIHNDGSPTIASAPPGAVLLSPELSAGAAHARAYRVDLAGGEGTLTWGLATANQAKADFLTVRNADPTTPVPAGGFVDESQGSNLSSVVLPSATVARDGSWFFHSMSNDLSGPPIALANWPSEVSQANPDERRIEDVGESHSLSHFSALETGLLAGNTGTRTYTIASNESMQTIGIVIQPAEGMVVGGEPPTLPSQIIEIPGVLARIESGVTGNNSNA